MTTLFLRLSALLTIGLALFGSNALAQQPAGGSWSPVLADPNYAARKQQRTMQTVRMPAVPRVRPTTAGAGTAPTAQRLPACFVPLDTTANSGWQHLSRQPGFADDSYKGPIPLGFSFSLYGNRYTEVYINTNGNISFGQGFTTYTASGLPVSTPMIAPFWADVDTEVPDTSATTTFPSGNVWFKRFSDRLVVTWNSVAYYQRHADKKNTFQVTIMANTAPGFTGDDVFFAYGDMQWTTGTADGGSNGFGGTPATVGVNKGDGVNFIQVGRFNLTGTSHPNNVDPSGVDWLDYQCLSFKVGASSNNIPPSVTGMPAGNTITLTTGETRNLSLQFLGPEVNQSVTVTTNTGGLCGTNVANNGATNPTVNVSITGAACNLGTHNITFQAIDNGSPVASQTFSLTVVVTRDFTWTGAISTDWFAPGNWSGNTVPTSADNAIIPTGAARMPVVATGTATANALTIGSGATLTVNQGTIFTLAGDLANNGQLLGAGLLQTSGSSQQVFSGTGSTSLSNVTIGIAGVSLSQPLALDRLLTLNGNLASNGNLTLRSTSTSTAMVINNGSATVSGSTTVQRFIGPATGAQMGYRHLASPVTNTSVADMTTSSFSPVINPNYNLSATPGTTVPFPTVFRYDQTRTTTGSSVADFDMGWMSPSNNSESMAPGVGYIANMMGGQMMDFAGSLGNGTFTRSGLGRGTGAQAGWHLLGNPYPAPIDWTLLRPNTTGLDNAVYMFRSTGRYTGAYVSYVNGVSSDTARNNIIPMGQAFFVRTTTPGTSASATFTNAARLTYYTNPNMQRTTAETRPMLRLRLQGATAADQMVVYFEQGATAGFDPAFDAYRLGNSNTVQLGVPAGAAELSISGLPALGSTAVTVPLAVHIAQGGAYTLQNTELINLPTGWMATLHDAATGAAVNLQQQPSYTCTLDPAQTDGRFSIVFTPGRPTAVTAAQLSGQIGLYPNPAHDAVSLSLPSSKQALTVTVSNTLGQVVRTQHVAASHGNVISLPLGGLAKGVYTVRVALPEGLATKRLVVE